MTNLNRPTNREIIEIIKNQPNANNKNMKGLIKLIKERDIDLYEEYLLDGTFLSDYKIQTHLGHNLCALLFTTLTPLLFSDKQVSNYFLKILIKLHSEEETWVQPIKYKIFRDITGYIYEHYKERNFILGFHFDNAYDEFIKNHYYPQTYIDETTLLIKNNHPLISAKEKFYTIYGSLNAGDSFLKYLDLFIVDRVSEANFINYLETMVQSFINELPIVSMYTISTDRLLDNIFGYHWSFSMHMNMHKYKPNRSVPGHLRIHKLILRVIFPYIYSDYLHFNQRSFVYKQLEFSSEEIERYENLSRKVDRNESAHYKLTVPDNFEEQILPNGSSFAKLFSEIDSLFSSYFSSRIAPSKQKFISHFFDTCSNEIIVKDIKYCLKTPSMKVILNKYIDHKIIELKRSFYESNATNQTHQNDVWILYYPYLENYKYTSVDFRSLPTESLKKEMKLFVKYHFNHHEKNRGNRIYNDIISSLEYLNAKFGIKSASDITADQILMLYHYFEIEKGYRPSTLKIRHYSFIKFIDYLVSLNKPNLPVINNLKNITLKNAHAHSEKTKSIPDDILTFLDNHIHELRKKDVTLMYFLLMETGWRFGDMVALTDQCAKPDKENPEIANILVSSPKTKKHRVKNGLGDTLEDVISISTYNLLIEYVESTRPIREAYGVTTLFFTITNGVISKYQSSTFNKAIKKLCESYGIQSIDENYWNTNTRQTRKTVATSLISSGASLSSVQKKLGHVSSKTTEQIYAEVHNSKIAELNTDFYKKKFDILMDDEKLKLFTEEERRHLYIDFHLHRRDVELGVCTKHPSEGRCSILGYTNCAECPKLCTGKNYLKKWESLSNASKEAISEFEKIYTANKIAYEDYKDYIEYTQEQKLLAQYDSVIKAIEQNK